MYSPHLTSPHLSLLFSLALVVVVSLGNINTIAAQKTFVNKEWEFSTVQGAFGQTVCSLDPYGNLVSAVSAAVGNSSNIIITSLTPAGDVDWQQVILSSSIPNSYLVDQEVDDSGYIYVATALFNGTNHDISISKYDGVGTLIWNSAFNGQSQGNDIPTALAIDNSGNVYVAGMVGSATLTDFITLKYSNSGTLLWTDIYNYNGNADGATDLVIDENGFVYVGGFSAETNLSADFTIRKLDFDGNAVGTIRHASPGIGFDLPVQMDMNANNQVFLVGTSVNGLNKNIKVLAIDDNLNESWVDYIDNNGLIDEGNALLVDPFGDLIITGSISRTATKSQQYTTKYNGTSGTQIWEHFKGSSYSLNAQEKGIQIALDSLNQPVVVGDVMSNGKKWTSITAIDQTGTTIFIKDLFSDQDQSSRQIFITGKDIYVVGFSDSLGQFSDQIMKISTYEHQQSGVLFDPDSIPIAVDNEILVRFKANSLLTNVTDDKGITWGSVNKFLTNTAMSNINQALGFDFGRLVCYKMHPSFTSTDTLGQNLYGGTYQLPPLYASFVVQLDQGANEEQILLILNALNDYIDFAEYNSLLKLSNCGIANTNDPFFCDGSSSPNLTSPTAGINIEHVWAEYTTGDPSISVGVFDTGINQEHEDYSFDGTQATSAIKGGFNYFGNTGLVTGVSNDQNGHGTYVAGIIGARRNNGKGIAGIAGGNGLNEPGVSIYDMKVGVVDFGVQECAELLIASDMLQAIFEGIVGDEAKGIPHFDIINASFSYHVSAIDIFPNGLSFKEAFQTAYTSGTKVFVSSGNSYELSDNLDMPASYPDRYLMRVGANDGLGLVPDFSNGANTVDFIAPGIGDLYKSLSPITNTDYGNYDFVCFTDELISGTSFAAPHAAGVAALLLSYYKTVTPAPDNYLTVEDVEHLMQYYTAQQANNTEPPFSQDPFTDKSGWGRIDAGELFEHIKSGEYMIKHYTFNVPFNPDLQEYGFEGNEPSITCVERELPGLPAIPYNNTQVNVLRWPIIGIHQPYLPEGYNIITAWANGAESNTLGLNGITYPEGFIGCGNVSGFNNNFLPDIGDHILVSTTPNLIEFIGYTYQFGLDGPDWYPIFPGGTATFSYSLYLTTNEVPEPIVSTTDQLDNNFAVYPNPAQSMLNVQLNEISDSILFIYLFDVFGKEILKHRANSNIETINTNSIPNGVYFVQVVTSKRSKIQKIIINK